jgi:hypothetical protein
MQINVSWKLGATDVVRILAFEKSNHGRALPTSRKRTMEIVRNHLRAYGDGASYEEIQDEDDAAAKGA